MTEYRICDIVAIDNQSTTLVLSLLSLFTKSTYYHNDNMLICEPQWANKWWPDCRKSVLSPISSLFLCRLFTQNWRSISHFLSYYASESVRQYLYFCSTHQSNSWYQMPGVDLKIFRKLRLNNILQITNLMFVQVQANANLSPFESWRSSVICGHSQVWKPLKRRTN